MTREQREGLAALLPEGRVRFDEPMSQHSAVAAGGPAEAFVCTATVEELRRLLAWAQEQAIDYRFWGAGSATLVRDGGLAGLVIALGEEFDGTVVERQSEAECVLRVGAATRAAALLTFCEAQMLSGMEPMARERGTVGGALCSSAGIAEETLLELTMVTKEGKELTLTRSGLRFEEGRLKIPQTAVIARVQLRAVPRPAGDAAELRVCEAAEELESLPCLTRVFTAPCKTGASVLIEEAGLAGVRVGMARVSARDANTIVNEGRATARDIVVLMNLMRDRVREHSGVTLEPAIEVVGER
jgi:UDP-N-acetylmuramate dehydrogenase